MSLNDVFGPFPGRPDHPDFAILADIVLQQDGRSYDADFDYGSYLSQFIDPASLRHMCQQRAMMIAQRMNSRPQGAPGPDPEAEWWTTTDVATFIGVSVSTVSNYRARGQMPVPEQTVGQRTHLWRPATIIEWHASRPNVHRRTGPDPRLVDSVAASMLDAFMVGYLFHQRRMLAMNDDED